MRTLYEIIDSAKSGDMPTHEECYYAMLVYEFMFTMDHIRLREELLAENRPPEMIRKLFAENSFRMYKGALDKSPKEYLGWNDNPANPEYQKRRKIGEKILDKAIKNIDKEGEK